MGKENFLNDYLLILSGCNIIKSISISIGWEEKNTERDLFVHMLSGAFDNNVA